MYYVVAESLTNVAKYASASEVNVRATCMDGLVVGSQRRGRRRGRRRWLGPPRPRRPHGGTRRPLRHRDRSGCGDARLGRSATGVGSAERLGSRPVAAATVRFATPQDAGQPPSAARAVLRISKHVARVLPLRPHRAAVEVAILASLYGVYEAVRGAGHASLSVARDHTSDIVALERPFTSSTSVRCRSGRGASLTSRRCSGSPT